MSGPYSRYIDGFPSLAAFIASDRDRTSVIFKKFSRLAARNLLLLQGELAELEAQLDAYDREDGVDQEALQSLRNWRDYRVRNGEDSGRMRLLRQVRATMKEYREALLFESTIASIPSPDRKTLKAFQLYFFHGRAEAPTSFPMLGGPSSQVYNDPGDLIVLRSAKPPDRLTMFVQDNFSYLFKEDGPDEVGTGALVGYASGEKISTLIAYISIILAALLLVGAIIVLYNIPSDNMKLGLLALFTVVFAASVGILSNATRAEVFGATAAYAAVLVVFVSGNLGS